MVGGHDLSFSRVCKVDKMGHLKFYLFLLFMTLMYFYQIY